MRLGLYGYLSMYLWFSVPVLSLDPFLLPATPFRILYLFPFDPMVFEQVSVFSPEFDPSQPQTCSVLQLFGIGLLSVEIGLSHLPDSPFF